MKVGMTIVLQWTPPKRHPAFRLGWKRAILASTGADGPLKWEMSGDEIQRREIQNK
jgi:hypothetical protein